MPGPSPSAVGPGPGFGRRGLLTAGVVGLLAGCGRDEVAPPAPGVTSGPVTPSPSGPTGSPSPTRAEITAILTRRAAALRAGDVTAAGADVAPTARAAVATVDARAVAAGLAELDLTLLDVRAVAAASTSAATHEASVAAADRLDGEGRAAGCTVRWGLLRVDDAWVLTPAVDPGTPQPWDLGDTEARPVPDGVVLRVAVPEADGGSSTATARADALTVGVGEDLADATARVRQHWGEDWPRGTGVVVCSTAAAAGRLAGVDPDRAQALDALAVGLDGTLPSGAPAGVRVVVQPDGFAALSRLGQQVTLTHELVHVAARATTTASLPAWLVEGYADHVARLDRGLDPVRLAEPLLTAVAAGRTPEVPDETAYASSDENELQIAYASGWTLVTSAARRSGTPAVTAFYRDLAAPGGAAPDPDELPARIDVACTRHLGGGFAQVRQAWVDDLRSGLAGWT